MRSLKSILSREHEDAGDQEPAPERCLSCDANLEGSRTYERFRVCHACGFHFHLRATERVATIVDRGSFREVDRGVTNIDPISFRERQPYRTRIIQSQRRTGLSEAALTGGGTLFGREIVIAVLDFAFLGGSIGVAAGERLARAFERAASRRVPIVLVCSTSGIRMREGLLALMQMPRILAARQTFEEEGLPYVAVLADPTTGTAYSGFINQADFLIAEPNALIGHAALGALRTQEGAELPKGAHTSDWHLERGLIDAVVPRSNLRDFLSLLLDALVSDFRLTSIRDHDRRKREHSEVAAWQQLQLSRHSSRPTAKDFIRRMTTSFIEIHGDRSGDDDPSVIAGVAILGGGSCVVIGQQRSHTGGELGWIRASGFRKAIRAIRLAERFNLPVVTLIDTSGVSTAILSEEASGVGHAISSCMDTMLRTPVPTVAVITGEGNSEAAVAMAVADRVLMLDNAVYEVIRPEDAVRILHETDTTIEDVTERLRITSHDCLRLGVVDELVPEPDGGAHNDHEEAALLLRRSLLRSLTDLDRQRTKRRLKRRHERYRNIGSTRSWVRGTLERRIAHVMDRAGAGLRRVLRRGSGLIRKDDYADTPDIPV